MHGLDHQVDEATAQEGGALQGEGDGLGIRSQRFLDLGTQLTMLLVLMLTSKGIAGVPRASLVVVTATCALFKIPPEGIALILPIDHFCDMFRTMTNVVGNALATSVVSKWEGELKPDMASTDPVLVNE